MTGVTSSPASCEKGTSVGNRVVHPVCVKLRELRKAANLSLTELQDRHGINAVLVGSYERGDRVPPLPKLDKLLAAYGYQLSVEPIEGAAQVKLPGDIVAELRAIADQVERTHDVPAVHEPAAPVSGMSTPDYLHVPAPFRERTTIVGYNTDNSYSG